MRQLIGFIGLLCSAQLSVAQVLPVDTTQWKLLGYKAYMALIAENHPIAKQSALLSEQAKARLRSARGGFDPVLYTDARQKEYKASKYYAVSESGLKVPTWFGLEGKVAYEWNDGAYLNPENEVPQSGLGVVGVSWDVSGGIFLDERRATLKQAKVFFEMNEAKRVQFLNNLYLDASLAYWEWAKSHQNLLVFESAYNLSFVRYQGVVSSYTQGDVPAIDTLEAFIQVQNRTNDLLEARKERFTKRMKVSTFLWLDGVVPLELEELTHPESIDELSVEVAVLDSVSAMLSGLRQQHPLLQQYALKVRDLEINQRFKRSKMIPSLKLNYNFLTTGGISENAPIQESTLQTSDYKFGIQFKMPLLLRSGRGEVMEARVKIEQAELDLELKSLEVLNKARIFQNELTLLREQVVLYRNAVLNYRKMLAGERVKFENGESSVFLMNSREMKLVQAQVKLVKLETEFQQGKAKLYHALGRLSNL